MECLYLPDLETYQKEITIDNEEFHHLKVLRIRTNDEILCSNGVGTIALLRIKDIDRNKAVLKILDIKKKPFPKHKLAVALGILDNKDRFEFAIEKCVELGVSDFYPLVSQYSQKRNINLKRLELKSISALKQSKQYWKMNLHKPISLQDVFSTKFDNYYFADIDSNSKLDFKNADNIIIIGPEGGFSEEEIKELYKNQAKSFSLGQSILRAETATICSVSIFKYLSSNI